jgi:hypothetical protein
VNYAVFSLFTTLYIVFLFHFGGFSQTSAANIRLFNTALGGKTASIPYDSLYTHRKFALTAWTRLSQGSHDLAQRQRQRQTQIPFGNDKQKSKNKDSA